MGGKLGGRLDTHHAEGEAGEQASQTCVVAAVLFGLRCPADGVGPEHSLSGKRLVGHIEEGRRETTAMHLDYWCALARTAASQPVTAGAKFIGL